MKINIKNKILLSIVLFVFLLSLTACSTKPNEKNIELLKDEENVVTESDVSSKSEKYFVEKGITIEKDKPLPNFALEGLDGSVIELSKYKGEYVILNFWATWCKYCATEMPDLEDFANNHKDFALIAINVDEPKEIVKKYIEDGGYSFEVALDFDGNVAKEYGISAYPTSYFLDKNGNLVGVVQGMLTKEGLNDIYEYILEK